MSDIFDHECDAINDLLFGSTENGEEEYPTALQTNRKTCKYCGLNDLSWMITTDWWRLAKNGVRHFCKSSTNDMEIYS